MDNVSKWWVYIVRCADDTLYTGVSCDVEKRVRAHNLKSGAKYTRSRLPVALVYKEVCAEKPAALKREAAIKKLSRTAKLTLINETVTH